MALLALADALFLKIMHFSGSSSCDWPRTPADRRSHSMSAMFSRSPVSPLRSARVIGCVEFVGNGNAVNTQQLESWIAEAQDEKGNWFELSAQTISAGLDRPFFATEELKGRRNDEELVWLERDRKLWQAS
jgi:hypothetical protein